MLDNWQAFLEAQGAIIDNGVVTSFNSQANEIEATIICDLSHYSLFKVTGEDATSFLQGQLSNDITHVSKTQSQMSSYCSPKGRALALFRIFSFDTGFYLSLPSEIAEKTISRLKMFVMRSDVTIEDVSENTFHFGIAGNNASDALSKALNIAEMPADNDSAIVTSNFSLQKLAGSTERFEIFGFYENAAEIWGKLRANCVPMGNSAWDLQRINAAIPEILTETSDAFVPQMLNLQLLNTINFQKGCYPGQEIVARTKYLGKLKKRLYLAEITTENEVFVGADLYETGDNQQSVGKLVLIAPSSPNNYRFLAVLRISATDNQPILLANKMGTPIKLLELPYPLEE